MFPVFLRDLDIGEEGDDIGHREELGLAAKDLYYHVLSALNDPQCRKANECGLRIGRPRIPLPGEPKGLAAGAAETLAKSIVRGRILASLLEPAESVDGVTQGKLRPALAGLPYLQPPVVPACPMKTSR